MDTCDTKWCIDWAILFDILVHCPEDRSQRKRYGREKFMNKKLKHSTKISTFDLIESSIRWIDNDYIGYCRPYLYPHIAFLGVQDIDTFDKLMFSKHHHGNKKHKKRKKHLNSGGIKMLAENSGLAINIKNENGFMSMDELLLSLESNLSEWRNKHSLFDTRIIRNDSIRMSLLTNEFISLWKFGSLNVFADPIDVKMINDNINNVRWMDEYFFDKLMYIEISVVFGWDRATHNETRIITNIKNRFLCVFNDGTTIFANYHLHEQSVMLIQCNVTDNLKLKHSIYLQTWQKYNQYQQQHQQKQQQQEEEENSNDIFTTSIGLTLFGIFPKRDNDHLFHEFIVSTNVQLPVCAHIQVNRKPKIYRSEWDYHFNTNNKDSSLHTSIKFYNDTNSQTIDQKRFDYNPRYYLSGVSAVSPSRKSGQMDIITLQWLDYHLFQGFDHFFIYDHLNLRIRTDNDIEYFYKLLKNDYIDKGYVTLIEWPFIKHQDDMWTFEFAAYFDSYRRFGYDTKFIYTGDCDEFLIPKPNRSIVVKVNKRLKNMTHHDGSGFGFDWHFAQVKYEEIIDSEMINAKQIVTANYELENYNGLEIFTYPALPSVIKFWKTGYIDDKNIYVPPHLQTTDINDNMVQVNMYTNGRRSRKQLGCDVKNEQNRFDTFFERQSCLYYISVASTKQYHALLKQGKQNADSIANTYTDKDKDSYSFTFERNQSLAVKIGTQLTKGRLKHSRGVYEVVPKMIIEAKNVLFGFFHRYYQSRAGKDFIPSYDFNFNKTTTKNDFDIRFKIHQYNETKTKSYTRQYDMFIVHLRDHWNNIAKRRKGHKRINVFHFDNSEEMKYFYSFTQNKCDFQNLILYWNKRFLNSPFGRKWNNKTLVDPLVDKDGVFCYFK